MMTQQSYPKFFSAVLGSSLVLAVLFSGCGAPPWKSVTVEEAGFTVSMPEEPVRKVEKVPTAVGTVEVVFFNLEYRHVAFITAYADYPESYVRGTTVDAILSGARDGGLAEFHGTLLRDERLENTKYPGRRILIASPDGRRKIESRIFLAGRRFYQAMVITPSTGAYASDAARFLDSYAITNTYPALAGESAPWSMFKSENGRFSILTAGGPRYEKQPLSTKYGFIELHSFPFEDTGFSYVVSYSDYPEQAVEDAGGAALMLKAVEANMCNHAAGVSEGGTVISLTGGHAGRAFTIRPSEPPFLMRCRTYLVGRRLYKLVVVYPGHATDTENIDVFLKSFTVLQ